MITNVCSTKGGQCSNIVPDFSYHNSFLIADCKEVSTLTKDFMLSIWIFHCISQNIICLKPKMWGLEHQGYLNIFYLHISYKAWVLETADKLWVAERVEEGPRNISNCMSITTKYWEYPFSVLLQTFENTLFQYRYKVLRISFFNITHNYKALRITFFSITTKYWEYLSFVSLQSISFFSSTISMSLHTSRMPNREKVD